VHVGIVIILMGNLGAMTLLGQEMVPKGSVQNIVDAGPWAAPQIQRLVLAGQSLLD